jgi:histidyl-tRNA synthetase
VKKLQAPRGTLDVLPPDARRRLEIVGIAGEVLGRAGYEPIETPVFEDTELFARGVGESTDIVQKEMFTFEDKAGRSLTLRPEQTAGICRAYIEHGMHKLPQPVKVWSAGPFFRHEAPQAGRFRQFTQIDAEAIGSDDPSLDAELILLLAEIYERAGSGASSMLCGCAVAKIMSRGQTNSISRWSGVLPGGGPSARTRTSRTRSGSSGSGLISRTCPSSTTICPGSSSCAALAAPNMSPYGCSRSSLMRRAYATSASRRSIR